MWRAVFTHWDRRTSPDLQRFYGIDTDDDELMQSRRWRWLRGRILSLLDQPDSLLGRTFDQ